MIRTIIVSPHIRRDGTKHPNAFDARLAGSDAVLCVSETLLFSAARVLLKTGKANADDVLAMRHAGSAHDALRARVGVAAGLVIEETRCGPRRRKFKVPRSMALPPPIEQTPPLVPEAPPTASDAWAAFPATEG